MWICAGEDVTSDSEIQQPAPPRPSRQRGARPTTTRADGWSGDGTACALAWLNIGVHDETDEKGRSQGRGNGGGEDVGV